MLGQGAGQLLQLFKLEKEGHLEADEEEEVVLDGEQQLRAAHHTQLAAVGSQPLASTVSHLHPAHPALRLVTQTAAACTLICIPHGDGSPCMVTSHRQDVGSHKEANGRHDAGAHPGWSH